MFGWSVSASSRQSSSWGHSYALWNRDHLIRDAKRQVEALRAGDGKTVASFALPEELEHTPAPAIERLIAEIVTPRLRLARFNENGVYELVNSPPTQSVGGVRGRLENGQNVSLLVAVFDTEKGGKSLVVQNSLFHAWQMLDRSENPNVPKEITRTYLNGLRADRVRLEAMGVSGMYCGPDRGFVTWDECERTWSQRLASRERSRAQLNNRPQGR